MIKRTLVLILIITWNLLQAQTPALNLKSHFKSLSKNQSSYLSKESMESYYKDVSIIQTLEKYLNDKKEAVQKEAVRLTARIGSKQLGIENRERAVFQLLLKVSDASPMLTERIVKGLQKFKVEDFNTGSVEQLLTLIEGNASHLGEFIKLAGFLQLSEPLLKMKATYAEDKNLKRKIGMALVRSGDEQKIESLMTTLKEHKVNDEFISGAVPLLVYARQKETTDFLFDIIKSEEKACTPNGPDVGGRILCAYRVMEEIAPYVVDFPVQVGASGDLDVEDYKKALKEVRAWIETHKEDYELRLDLY